MSLYKIKLIDIGRGEGVLSSDCQQSGKMKVDLASPENPPKILLGHESFTGEQGSDLS